VLSQELESLDGVRAAVQLLRVPAREVACVAVGGLRVAAQLVMQPRQLVQRDALAVVVGLGALVATDGLRRSRGDREYTKMARQ
jgi:hypothetical protein